LPKGNAVPTDIVAGPDGALWFTEGGWTAIGVNAIGSVIGRITTTGSITEYTTPTNASSPGGITVGPDKALWFTEACADGQPGNKIGRITTSGSITEYTTPTTQSYPTSIATGPDGALWFTEWCADKIGRITTGGTVSEYPTPTSMSRPQDIVAGPNSAMWFTEGYANKIGTIPVSIAASAEKRDHASRQ
jgi:virginiamycin B lyase